MASKVDTREAFARYVTAEVEEYARQARNLGLDTLGYLLDMVALEARQYTATHDPDVKPEP